MKKEKPLVTIVTITFNLIKAGREKFFRQCLESVYNQTYKNIEHIVVDGASTDGTLDLLKEYTKKGWIKYISESDSGVYFAMNKGIKMASGKYLAFLNSDDFYHNKEGVEVSVKALEENEADFSYAPVINFDYKSGIKNSLTPDISKVFFSIVPNHQTMFTRREIIINEGFFNTKYKSVADYDLTIRLCLKKYKCVFVKSTFTTYRLGGYSFEATKQGTVFKEVSDIYYQNYNKLCHITREDCEKICGDMYSGNYNVIPLKLAKKLKDKWPYFNYNEYVNYSKPINKLKKYLISFLFKCYKMIKYGISSPKEFIKKCILRIKNILFYLRQFTLSIYRRLPSPIKKTYRFLKSKTESRR